ncbi:MAG: transcription-repair coupling factor [Verrucomicrobia bacterium]|nr:transcription-repair coupling factor [Verrucomicrobiota bacterium]
MWIKQILDKFADRLKQAAAGSSNLRLPAMPLSAEALAVLALRQAFARPVIWITDGSQTLETAHRDLLAIAPGMAPGILYFPPWETLPFLENADDPGAMRSDPQTTGNRFAALLKLRQPGPSIVATSIQALMQKTLSPSTLAELTISISVGEERDPDAMAGTLTSAGYEFVPEVQEKGQATVRGGLLDVWPPSEPLPVRVEFFGSQIESIRLFSPAEQTSLEQIKTTTIPPADEWRHLASSGRQSATLIDHLTDQPLFVWSDEDQVLEHATMYQTTIDEANAAAITVEPGTLRSTMAEIPGSIQVSTGSVLTAADPDDAARLVPLDIRPVEAAVSLPHGTLEPDALAEARKRLMTDLGSRAAAGQTVAIFFDTQGSADHFRADLPARVQLELAALSGGFISDWLGLVIVAEADLYGRRKKHARRYNPLSSRRLEEATGPRVASVADIEPGDLVVHVEHGIGKYLGMFEIMFSGRQQEVLTVEYADSARLHVPISQAHLLSRYVGIAGHKVELHRIGGRRWRNDKIAAETAIQDIAATMLETQAQRNLLDGFRFPADTPWQKELEAAFPFRETIDQSRAIEAVRKDMESARPMDRLVCGDAGYGKTEVAVRAAFKAVMAAKQVAILVPTTILAQQHYETFRERMSAYPVRIEMLSRFCSASTHYKVVKGLADGSVDVVIGTHALLQPGISFKDLGLVVIDEEQRFGVAHKETLKNLRKLVDVITMTATPIPRTLYMAMTGARDMSIIQTPPRERMPVETVVAPATDKIVREAIMRELTREGQVFYLHNRVMTIDIMEKKLRALVPEAKIAVAHGQMAAGELAEIMHMFISGELNVLLCTTIIESGVDIPSANTILIDRADRFGMADLYQLRGRVGRSNCKGYAYFLLPHGERIDADARKRMETLKRYSHLGAGFNLALRDLEIRGSGNLLGTAQSGHITAIGFDLYCKLLRRTISRLKGEPLPPIIDVEVKLDFVNLFAAAETATAAAVIPYAYVEDERLRIGAYRKMAEASTKADVAAIRMELRDRFGPLPPQVERLLKIVEIRVAAAEHSIKEVETQAEKLLLKGRTDYLMKGKLLPRLSGRTVEEKLTEIFKLISTSDRWAR